MDTGNIALTEPSKLEHVNSGFCATGKHLSVESVVIERLEVDTRLDLNMQKEKDIFEKQIGIEKGD